MAGLRQSTANIIRYRRRFQDAGPAPEAAPPLTETADFGSNPGALRMLGYRPEGLPPGAPLVVLLHGCGQTAAAFAHSAGWTTMANLHGFGLLCPEQRTANNENGCFNWFLPGDTRGGRGEAMSIRAMVEHSVQREGFDPGRVFVAGLSAGGAMAAAMLAVYPEVFAAGAILSGLPYGTAANTQQALESMYQGRSKPAREWAYLVRRASRHKGPWPRVSVWHGGRDSTVHPTNAGEIIKQWTELHGLPLFPTQAGLNGAHQVRTWLGPDGETLLESHNIAGLAHGVPISAAGGEGACGAAGPYAIDVGISSTHHIARFFGLAESASGMLAANSQTSPGGRKLSVTRPFGS